MCTVSLIPWSASSGGGGGGGAPGYRLVHNRDELRTRAPGLGPSEAPTGVPGVTLRRPIDPDSGGTWIATTDLGLTLCVLNVNPPPSSGQNERRSGAPRSRGLLIPAIVEVEPGMAPSRLGAALLDRLGGEDGLRAFAPFRLLAVGSEAGGELSAWSAIWVDGRLEVGPWGGCGRLGAICAVSSGLGDEAVAARVPLFEVMVAGDPRPAAQDLFHRHRWADRPELSVRMSRARARTVAITTVEVAPGAGVVRMRYEPLPEEPPPG